jgi:hypothetical protein
LILLLVRILLAAVFAIAAAGKLVNHEKTAATLAEFGVPDVLRRPLAVALPLTELVIAAALLPAATAPWAGVAATVMLAAFTFAVARVLARGEAVDCNCFGSLGSSRITRWTAARNVSLLLLAATVAIAGWADSRPSALSWLGDLDSTEAIGLAAAGLAACLLIGQAWFSWQLFKQNGRLLVRVRALEGATGISESPSRQAHGLPEGTIAPGFELLAAAGDRRSLQDLLAPGLPVALVFSDPGCSGCADLAKRLPALRAELADVVEPVLVTRGEATASSSERHASDLTVLLQRVREVAAAYHANAVPSAVVVGNDGRIASSLAVGEDAVERLLFSVGPKAPELQVLNGVGAGR